MLKSNTLDIMPPTVSPNVCQKFKPRAAPVSGPPKNLTMLSRKTERYLATVSNTALVFYRKPVPFLYGETANPKAMKCKLNQNLIAGYQRVENKAVTEAHHNSEFCAIC